MVGFLGLLVVLESYYAIMSVSAARKMGILLIGFKSNAEFALVAR